ncbi:MAG TPA: Rieske 2Fe-2S domain-containing protein, partial [Actinomycetota bacterium]
MAKTEQEIKIRNDEVEWQPRPTLGSADYASLEVWEQERERIWFGEWICAGRAEEIPNPGDHIVRDIAGESIFIVRNDAGEIRAFYNVC